MFSRHIRTALTALTLMLWSLSGIAETTVPQLTGATYFGSTGDEKGTGVAIAGGSLFMSGKSSANGGDGIAAMYALPLASGALPTWSTTWPGVAGNDEFSGVALTSEGGWFSR